jgi:hypothetical protein
MGNRKAGRQGSDDPSSPGGTKPQEQPAGNAVYDPVEQTRREDMPDEEQASEGEILRGTNPAEGAGRAPGRSQ